jgi:hypothetical protein
MFFLHKNTKHTTIYYIRTSEYLQEIKWRVISRTTCNQILFRRTTLLLAIKFTPLLKFQVLYTFFPAKNTGTYSSKKPANPHKMAISSTVNKRFQHGSIAPDGCQIIRQSSENQPVRSRKQVDVLVPTI